MNQLRFEIVDRIDLTDDHRQIFEHFLGKQNKVKGDLTKKADRCRILCFVKNQGEPVAIGAIKKKSESVFYPQKANVVDLESKVNWELGYIYVDQSHQGQGIATRIVTALLDVFRKESLMATTEIKANPAMVKVLERSGFRRYGKSWPSRIHKEQLGLFLRLGEST